MRLGNKIVVLCLFSLQLNPAMAQVEYSQNPFQEAFESMFQFEQPSYIIESTPPDPPVPIDGGLAFLLLTGGALGLRKIKGGHK